MTGRGSGAGRVVDEINLTARPPFEVLLKRRTREAREVPLTWPSSAPSREDRLVDHVFPHLRRVEKDVIFGGAFNKQTRERKDRRDTTGVDVYASGLRVHEETTDRCLVQKLS